MIGSDVLTLAASNKVNSNSIELHLMSQQITH